MATTNLHMSHSLEDANISVINPPNDQTILSEGDGHDASFVMNTNPLFQRGVATPMGSILLSKRFEEFHLEIPHNAEALLYDDAVACLKGFCENINFKEV
jgi:hypothetical protein